MFLSPIESADSNHAPARAGAAHPVAWKATRLRVPSPTSRITLLVSSLPSCSQLWCSWRGSWIESWTPTWRCLLISWGCTYESIMLVVKCGSTARDHSPSCQQPVHRLIVQCLGPLYEKMYHTVGQPAECGRKRDILSDTLSNHALRCLLMGSAVLRG